MIWIKNICPIEVEDKTVCNDDLKLVMESYTQTHTTWAVVLIACMHAKEQLTTKPG